MDRTLKKEIAKLGKLRVNELQAKFAAATGETTRSPNKVFLVRKITEALEAAAARAAACPAPPAPTPEVAAAAAVEPPVAPEPASGPKLSQLDVPALRSLYVEVVGRATGSSNSAYLRWKIREARKGRVPVGPRVAHGGGTYKVLPLRMEAAVVDQLDAAWRRQGLRSRMALIRRALASFLAATGEAEVAALLAEP
ncbi:MAG: hypothetical protein PHU25_17235 [Deltaproteobacteria bacterium]|nr:hypothetical protein [Deltaproteobacteria bacterium]